jgi:hypothetical protein
VDGVPIDSDILRLERALGTRQLRAVRGCLSAATSVDPALAPDERPLRLAPAGLVEVPVRSEPSGARLRLDGQDTGEVTPGHLQIDACAGGSVTIEKAGYRPQSVEIPPDIEPEGVRELLASVRLEPLPKGRIVIEPQGFPLVVREGKRRIGRAGQTLTFSPGRRKLILVNDDLFLRHVLTVEVTSDKTRRINPRLPDVGKLSVQAYPSNCRVYAAREDGGKHRFLEEVPMLDRPLAPGSYRVKVEYVPTGETQEKIVEIEPGARISLPFRFGS